MIDTQFPQMKDCFDETFLSEGIEDMMSRLATARDCHQQSRWTLDTVHRED